MAPFIQATNITLVFKPKDREPVAALQDFSLEIIRGEFVSIVGPSGRGKSTFLSILLGLLRPDRGEMALNGSAERIACESLLASLTSSARSIPWSLTRDLPQWPGGWHKGPDG